MMNQLHELEDALVKQILIAADSRKDSLKKKKILKTARKLWTLILDPESESKLSLYWGPFSNHIVHSTEALHRLLVCCRILI